MALIFCDPLFRRVPGTYLNCRPLTSLREKLIKIGAKVISHGRYVMFQMAEVVIPRDIFAELLRRMQTYGRPRLPRRHETCFGHPGHA